VADYVAHTEVFGLDPAQLEMLARSHFSTLVSASLASLLPFESSPYTKKFLTYVRNFFGARERTRTSMPLRALPPQGSACTNFATRAQLARQL
jgi:hypothetical protein